MTTETDARRPRWVSPLVRWGIFAVSLLLVVVGSTGLARALTPDERVATIVVVPHPDDEFQTWSLIEDTPNEYKIFVILTLGEQTQFCDPEGYAAALQAGLEPAPVPTPDGRWTTTCEEARMSSLRDYLSQMSESDPTIPGDFGVGRVSSPLPAEGTAVCRDDDGDIACTPDQRRVTTWVDAEDRGAIVSFDLGDGDLTVAEATWALQRVVDSRGTLGVETELPIRAMIGSFSNSDHACFEYPHPDHVAVSDALWRTDFGPWPRLAATCLLDPAADLTARVSDSASDAAFEVAPDGTRVGAHTTAYGWLHEAYYPLSRWTQSTLFMQLQSFWVRGND